MSHHSPLDFEGIRRRDREACEQLVREHYRKVYSMLFRIVKNEEDAADLTQDTFRKVWEKIDSYRGESSFSTWLFRIAHNNAMDWHRKRKHALSNIALEFDSDQNASACYTGLQNLIDQDEHRNVALVVDRLEMKEREVIILHYLHQLSIQQTADILGIALGTAKWRLNQALCELRRMLSQTSQSRRNSQNG